MKDTKHTPGPWVAEHAAVLTGKKLSDELICYVRSERSHADSRLIAAAPELLQMLQHAVELMEELKVGSHDVQVYKRVIQKAKGV